MLVALALLFGGISLFCAFLLEQRFEGLEVTETTVDQTPVTIYAPAGVEAAPLVVVAHGFGGSRQMMDQISVTLARAGLLVASFDFPGHGRNPVPMSPDITSLEAPTAQLVETTRQDAQAMQARPETAGTTSLVGHSMATDVIIRAAHDLPDVAAIAAISMYSEAVTADFPPSLLIVSGAFEDHLSRVALDAVKQIDPAAGEGDVAIGANTARKSIVAPNVGHVGVLYHAVTLDEIARWIANATGSQALPDLDRTGWVAGLLFGTLVLLAWPLSRLLPLRGGQSQPPLPLRAFLLAILLPVVPTLAVAVALPTDLGPIAGFVAIAAAFAIWGGVQLLILRRHRVILDRPDLLGTAILLFWGLGIFALALDRYGAAFLPTGPRLGIMALLLSGTLPLMIADTYLLAQGAFWRRVIARLALLATLTTAMVMVPQGLGPMFTILPVLLLFFVVYGSFGRFVLAVRGVGGIAIGMGICLAWAIAASTPLFAG